MKTKKQILSFYAVLIPALVLISIGISVQAQSQNEKVKQVIVLSDEKIEPEDVRIQIKNENGEFEELDSSYLEVIPINQAPISVFVNSNQEDEKMFFEQKWNFKNPDWEKIQKEDPKNISSVHVNKDSDKNTIIIRYKDGRKNDTIIKNQDLAYGYAYEFKDEDKIISPKELKLKIMKGEIDLTNPKNEWLKVWKENHFKEPINYNYNGNFEFNKNKNIKFFTNEDLQKLPNGMTFEIDSLIGPEQKMFFKRGKVTKTGDNAFYSDDMQIIYKDKKDKNEIKYWKRDQEKDSYGIPKISFENGKKPKVYIDGKVSTLKELKKIEKANSHKIQYMQSDGKEEIEKYGSPVSTHGVLIAIKKP